MMLNFTNSSYGVTVSCGERTIGYITDGVFLLTSMGGNDCIRFSSADFKKIDELIVSLAEAKQQEKKVNNISLASS